MRKYCQYHIAALFALLAFTTACEKDEPDLYNDPVGGVYFDYERSKDFERSINFAEHVVGSPQELSLKLNLKLLGNLANENRRVVIKAKPIDNLPKAGVVLPEVEMAAGSYEQEIEVKVLRPELWNTEYAVCIYLDGEDPASGVGNGVEGKREFVIRVKETYEEPEAWSAMGNMYLGPWSAEKQVLLTHVAQDNELTKKLYDYYYILKLNKQAVDSLRIQRQEHPEIPVTVDIPFSTDNQYDKPYYWGDLQDKYLGGTYNSSLFGKLAAAMGANTANEVEVFGGDEMAMRDLNKSAVRIMMREYNTYFASWGLPGSSYRRQFWIPLFPEIDYAVRQPAVWSSGAPGGGVKVSHYYGEYSEAKYKFMIKTWLEKKGTNEFVLVQMFPLVIDWNTMDAVWDDSIGGEEAIRECYNTFKAAYDSAPAGTYNFTFPTLP